MKSNINVWSYLSQLFLEWEMFQTKDEEKIKTHFMLNPFFFSENRTFYEIVWKNSVEPASPQMTI